MCGCSLQLLPRTPPTSGSTTPPTALPAQPLLRPSNFVFLLSHPATSSSLPTSNPQALYLAILAPSPTPCHYLSPSPHHSPTLVPCHPRFVILRRTPITSPTQPRILQPGSLPSSIFQLSYPLSLSFHTPSHTLPTPTLLAPNLPTSNSNLAIHLTSPSFTSTPALCQPHPPTLVLCHPSTSHPCTLRPNILLSLAT